MKPQPLNLFAQTADDMPLFSGTPQRAKVTDYRPKSEPAPIKMFAAACPVCFGTKQVKNRKGKTVPCMYC